jgi:UDP-N-acetylmuramoyl-tripeptide--D-alanyl-D-alanine ligase
LPLTLLFLRPEHELAIIEMGANKIGDIKELCEIAEPDMGLITNIGKEHLEGFGSIEGVAQAESELFDYLLKNNGLAFVNSDDNWLSNMSKRLTNKIEYGLNMNLIQNTTSMPHIHFKLHDQDVNSPLMGNHNLQNILACIAVAEHLETPNSSIVKGIESYTPINNRSQWVNTKNGNKVLLDAYNANPSSVEAALESFKSVEGPTAVILGDMFELGEHETKEHQNICNTCISYGFNSVYLVGKAFSNVKIESSSAKENVFLFKEKNEAQEKLQNRAFHNTTILIKGSRGMKMEELLDYL